MSISEVIDSKGVIVDRNTSLCDTCGVFHVGDVARKLRELAGWTIEDMASHSSLDKGTVSRFENKPEKAKPGTLTAIAKALKMTEADIYALVPPPPDQSRQAGRLKETHAHVSRGSSPEAGVLLPETSEQNEEVLAAFRTVARALGRIASGEVRLESSETQQPPAGGRRRARSHR